MDAQKVSVHKGLNSKQYLKEADTVFGTSTYS